MRTEGNCDNCGFDFRLGPGYTHDENGVAVGIKDADSRIGWSYCPDCRFVCYATVTIIDKSKMPWWHFWGYHI
jgi:hypothetical protein